MILYLGGWLVVVVAFSVAQTRFYDAHQRAHNQWRPRTNLWLFWYSAAELRAMLGAVFHRDTDTAVERARGVYLGVLAIAVAYLVIGFPLAVVTLS